jgi:tRNA uridine 5-carboxymethylaminomethyl modification enzyme
MTLLNHKIKHRDELIDFIRHYSVSPEKINDYLLQNGTAPIAHSIKLIDLVLRPQLTLQGLISNLPDLEEKTKEILDRKEEIIEAAEIEIKYAGYIEREKKNVQKLERLEHIIIPEGFDFKKINSLSMESRIKMNRIKPKTIGQASRIPGVSPADINVLLIHFGR